MELTLTINRIFTLNLKVPTLKCNQTPDSKQGPRTIATKVNHLIICNLYLNRLIIHNNFTNLSLKMLMDVLVTNVGSMHK